MHSLLVPAPSPALQHRARFHHAGASTPITHVVVIIQENRSVDNLFNGFPNADTTQYGYDSHGNLHVLQPVSLATECGGGHSHTSFVSEFNNGAMNGWDLNNIVCYHGQTLPDGMFAYVPGSETAAYWAAASNYALADEVFQGNEGPSFPAHQYLIAGQSGGHGADGTWAFAENGGGSSSSDDSVEQGPPVRHSCSNRKPIIAQIDFQSSYPGTEGNTTAPCKDYPTIFDLAMSHSPPLSWRYYANQAGTLWSAVDSIRHLWQRREGPTIPESTVLNDIASHQLPSIAYVTPSWRNSDHPHSSPVPAKAGPEWVARVVNAIGNDPYYWANTTILITWDDWGGWFDHAVYGSTMHPLSFPTDPYEYGFRVPLIVISPYVKAHLVDHTQRTFDSVITYIESTFALGSLGMQDSTTDDLSDMFDYSQQPLQFVPMPSK
ncbi:MAG: hypothetical protein JO043_09520 [Candidatus Eremiobacteraeota bacterium]|nr:hypothetical protein [Candidatus Eremiobacteraeota bacterium]